MESGAECRIHGLGSSLAQWQVLGPHSHENIMNCDPVRPGIEFHESSMVIRYPAVITIPGFIWNMTDTYCGYFKSRYMDKFISKKC